MNKIILIIFVILFVLFVFFMSFLGKGSIKNIILTYLKNYYSNAFEEKDRKFNIWSFIILGLMPYLLGVLLFLSFKEFFLQFDVNLLFQIDIIFLTVFCLFIGFDFKKDGKETVKKELIATLLINILFVVIAVVVLLVSSSIVITENSPKFHSFLKIVLYSIYFALNFKIVVMFFYSLKRVFILSSKE